MGGTAGAQEQWDFKFINTPARVPLTEVRDIAEDSRGAIWVATWGNGVARLGATDWYRLNERTGLAGNWVRGIAVGGDDTVWIATADGLCLFREEQLTCYTTATVPMLPSDNLDTVHATGAGDIVLGSRDGDVLLLRGAAQSIAGLFQEPDRWEVLSGPGSQQTRLSDLYEAPGGRLWFSQRGGGLRYYEQGVFSDLPTPGVGLLLAGNGAGEVWAAHWFSDTFLTFVDGAWKRLGTIPASANVLHVARDGYLYAGTEEGLYRWDGDDFTEVELGATVGQPYITSILEASDGSLWLGSQEGLIRGAPRSWQHFGESVEGEVITHVVADPDERLLAIDAGNGVLRFDGRGWRRAFRLDTTKQLGFFHAASDAPHLWAFGDDVVYQFSLEDGSVVSESKAPPSNADRRIFRTHFGETWLLAVDGIHALVDGAWEPRPAIPGYERRQVYSVAEVEPGVFYVGLMNGIERWTASGVTFFGQDEGLANGDATYTICPMEDGSIWFGTYGSGIFVYKGDGFTNISVSDGLAHHSVSNILEAKDGTVWVSYRRVGIGSYRDGRWQNFGMANNLPNASVLGLFEDARDQLWLQTRGAGIYRYRPNRTPPETRLEGATFEIPSHGIGVFSFSATDAWQVTPDHALLYSWRLVSRSGGGAPEAWSPYQTRATFITPSLEPGAYTVEVRASDDARNVDPTPATVDFRVYPPIWGQPGVYVPAAVLAILLLVAVALRIHANQNLRSSKKALSQSNRQLMKEIRERLVAEQRLNEHFEQLEGIVRARTSDLEAAQRALVQQERLAMLGKVTASVSHELRNPLGTLRSTIFLIGRKVQGRDLGLEDALSRAERSIKRCDRIIEEFLDFTRVVSMEREHVIMDAWLESTLGEMSFPENLVCHFTYESELSLSVDPERLRRAVVNVVNNAVQAMAETDGFARLRVKSRRREGRFEIVVKDNGPGITDETKARIFEPLYSTKGFGVGLGMPIVKDIMEKHHGGVEYHSVLGKGTTVVLWIPIADADADADADDGPETMDT